MKALEIWHCLGLQVNEMKRYQKGRLWKKHPTLKLDRNKSQQRGLIE